MNNTTLAPFIYNSTINLETTLPNYDENISFFTPARIIAISVLVIVFLGINVTIFINFLIKKKKKRQEKINNIALLDDTEMNYFFN